MAHPRIASGVNAMYPQLKQATMTKSKSFEENPTSHYGYTEEISTVVFSPDILGRGAIPMSNCDNDESENNNTNNKNGGNELVLSFKSLEELNGKLKRMFEERIVPVVLNDGAIPEVPDRARDVGKHVSFAPEIEAQEELSLARRLYRRLM